MKKHFIDPEVELIRLYVEDVITTSGYVDDLDEDELPKVPAR